MRFNFKKQLLMAVLMGGLSFGWSASAQTYVRYVKPEDIGTKVLYADSVLTSITLPRGVYRLADYPEFNAAAFELFKVLQNPQIELMQVWVCGSASPDGLWGDNVRLSQARTDAAVNYLRNVMHVPDHMIHKESLDEDWDRLAEMVTASDLPYKYEVLYIIRTKNWGERKTALQKLDGGRVWKILERDFFPKLRCVRFAIYCKWDPTKPYLSAPAESPVRETVRTVRDTVYVTDTVYIETPVVVAQPVPAEKPEETASVTVPEEIQTPPASQAPKSFYDAYINDLRKPEVWDTPWLVGLKTNLLADLAVLGNVGIQVQVSRKMSVGLAGVYTNRNVFYPAAERTGVDETKIYGFQPELRYWFNEVLTRGHSIGLHSNVLWYTMKGDKTTLYQNISNFKPAWAVGLDYGYTVPLSRNGRWGLEFIIGFGYGHYVQDKAKFSTEDNKWYTILDEPESGNYLGVTRLGVNLAYRFSVRKYDKTK